jgi:hypothetical protein
LPTQPVVGVSVLVAASPLVASLVAASLDPGAPTGLPASGLGVDVELLHAQNAKAHKKPLIPSDTALSVLN